MRVLIVKMSALGDIIHALPVLDYLHRVSPGIEIDWVVEEQFNEILAGNPLIARLHVVRTKVWRRQPLARQTRREIGDLKAALRERSYDLVFDIQGNLKSGLVDWLSGAEQVIGFDAEVLQEKANLFFTTRQVPIRRTDHHVTDQYLRLVSVPFGKDFAGMELATDIVTSPDDDSAADALLATLDDGLVFLFHYGTTWQTKFWTENGWIELGRAVLERFPASSILFSWGNEEERQVVMRLVAAIGNGARVIDRYPLKGLIALLKKVDLVVGGDTGPTHLAAAVGTPTVSFYRASDGRRSGPRGNGHGIVQAPLHCTKCFRTKCDDDQKCRESIRSAALLKEIERLLSAVPAPLA
ncbi:lipopolysaccharide heptosyltransferase I [Geomobilimonas luticola]|uniref:Lipopolysaccharide heptosyltransferase 1 n=1 Tax=Geomobilimonas luticola TaxID=1114878 RepID=A0ABS5SFT3_9BACT|nr:lipopolysaccharide heptosyltransferase I [Geomobilimonas luticola]MBT0654216.1 lipopolysaccharide heptosyltransferase I [Geomobilimonas luticola]